MACSPSKVCLGVGITGIVLVLLGALTGWVIVPKIVRSKIADMLPLRPGSESWDRWENLPVPIKYHFYIFNVSNPEEILKGKMPKVTEVGPFVYDEKRIKTLLETNLENSTVEYEQKILLQFDPESSAPLREDDVFTVVNVPALLFGQIVHNLKYINPVTYLYSTALEKMWPTENSNPVFIKAKVKDYIFNGLPILCNQPKTMNNLDTTILCEAFKILHPKTTALDDFGKNIHSFAFFNYKNKTSDGIYKIDLGIHDVTRIGQILSWNSSDRLSIWKAKSCNRILGTDATVFRPYLEEDNIESLYIYHTDICRSVKLTYKTDIEFKGVKGRRYVPDKSFFSSVLSDAENYCFCPQSVKNITRYGGCLRSGVLELSGCQGAPAVVSYPHFLMTDSMYQGGVEGLHPEFEKHQIFLDLESYTGYPLRAASRIQINSFLKAIPEIHLMKNLPNVLMPSIWFEEKVELTDELIDTIHDQLLNVLKTVDLVKWTVIGLGINLSIGSCVFYLLKIRRNKPRKV